MKRRKSKKNDSTPEQMALIKKQRAEWNKFVNNMTNHERNLWARDKYPGLKKRETAVLVERFPEIAKRVGM